MFVNERCSFASVTPVINGIEEKHLCFDVKLYSETKPKYNYYTTATVV